MVPNFIILREGDILSHLPVYSSHKIYVVHPLYIIYRYGMGFDLLITLHRKFYITYYKSDTYRDLTPRRIGNIPHLDGMTTRRYVNIP